MKTEPIDRRTALLKEAKRIFSQKGYEGTSVREIAENAGVNIALIGYYFGGKSGIYRQCVEGLGKERLAQAQRLLTFPNQRDEFTLRLKIFATELIESYLADPETTTIIHRECEMNETPPKEIDDFFRETHLEIFKHLVNYLTLGKNHGWLRSSLDPHLGAVFFFNAVTQLPRKDEAHKRYFNRSITDPSFKVHAIEQMLAIFLDGVTGVHHEN